MTTIAALSVAEMLRRQIGIEGGFERYPSNALPTNREHRSRGGVESRHAVEKPTREPAAVLDSASQVRDKGCG